MWIISVLAVIVLGSAGWWIGSIVEREAAAELADDLQTIRDADVAALRVWLTSQESGAQAAANDLQVKRIAIELAGGASPAPAMMPLRTELEPHLKAHGFEEIVICSVDGRIIAADRQELIGNDGFPFPEDLRERLFEQHRATVSRPFPSVVPLPNELEELRTGVPTMFVFAPVSNRDGEVTAGLGLRINPRSEFMRIMSIAREGKSGETMAFDRNGLLLSQSRFDRQLQRMRLIDDDEESSSMLKLELRDPQVNLTAGQTSPLSPSERPLTRMARDAVSGRSGVDVTGYRDYRGVTVVGAWTWLEDYGFGVATEINYAEAYRPFNLLRNVFRGLFGLLVLSSAGILAFALVTEFLQRRARRDAERFAELLADERAHALAEIRSRSEFLANLSGDIRAPLFSLLEMVDLTMETELSLQQRGYLSSALTSARTLEELLNQLLDLSKVEIGDIELRREAFQFRETLGDVLGSLRIQARSAGKAVKSRVPADVPDGLVGDVQRIRQVIKNIAARAIELSGPDGIVMDVSAGERVDDQIELECRITIRGNSHAGASIQALLKDFRRANSPGEHQSRSDLGVAVAARMLEFAGGRIWVEGADTSDCSICFASSVEVSEEDPPLRQRTELGLIPGLSVLIVDVDEQRRRALEQMLLHVEMVPTLLSSAEGLLPALDQGQREGNPFGLVIIDAEVDGPEDGFALCRKIKQSQLHAAIPVIIMTSVERADQIGQSSAAGAAAHLPKPVKSSLLEGAIVTAVLGRGRYQQLRKDLDAAATYVRSLIPPPSEEPLRINWRYVPATDLAGDALGFHWIDDDHCAFYVLDAVGHGIDACLMSVSILDAVKSQSLPDTDFRRPDQVLAQLNRTFPMESHDDRCFTAWYGVYQRSSATLSWAGGGHPPAVLLSQENGSRQSIQLPSTGPMIGMLPDPDFAVRTQAIPASGRLYVFSDGVFEIERTDGRLWTLEEFEDCLRKLDPGDSPLDRVWQHVHTLHGQETLDDDFTMLEVSFHGSSQLQHAAIDES